MNRFWMEITGILAGACVQIIGITFWNWDILTLVTTFFLESILLGIFIYITGRRANQHLEPDFLAFKVAFPLFVGAQLFFFFIWNFTFGHREAIPWLVRLIIGGEAWIPYMLVGMLTCIRGFYEMNQYLEKKEFMQVKQLTQPGIIRIFVQQFIVILGGGAFQVLGTSKVYGYLLVVGKLLIDIIGLYQFRQRKSIR